MKNVATVGLASFMDLSIRANTKPTADIIGSMKQLSVVLHIRRLSPLTLVAAPHRGVQILCPLVPISSMHVLRGGGRGGCGEIHAVAAFTPTFTPNYISHSILGTGDNE